MNLFTLKMEIANAVETTDLKIAKLEMSLKDYVVERIKRMRSELKLSDAEVIEQTHDAVGGKRKPNTITGWLREAGISQRGTRSDKGGERMSETEKSAASLQRKIDSGILTKEEERGHEKAIKALLAVGK